MTQFAKPNLKRARGITTKAEFARKKAFREAIWRREDGRDRATGERLYRPGTDDWRYLGDVCHIQPVGAHPDRRYDLGNAILLSRWHHIQSDGRGGYKLKIVGTDANGPLTFRMTNAYGETIWEHTTEPRCPLPSGLVI